MMVETVYITTLKTKCFYSRHFKSTMDVFELSPEKFSQDLEELVMFLAQVRDFTLVCLFSSFHSYC